MDRYAWPRSGAGFEHAANGMAMPRTERSVEPCLHEKVALGMAAADLAPAVGERVEPREGLAHVALRMRDYTFSGG